MIYGSVIPNCSITSWRQSFNQPPPNGSFLPSSVQKFKTKDFVFCSFVFTFGTVLNLPVEIVEKFVIVGPIVVGLQEFHPACCPRRRPFPSLLKLPEITHMETKETLVGVFLQS